MNVNKIGLERLIALAIVCQFLVCMCGVLMSCRSRRVLESDVDSLQLVTESKDLRVESVRSDCNLSLSFDSLDVWFLPVGNQSFNKEDSSEVSGLSFLRNHRLVRVTASNGNLSLNDTKKSDLMVRDSVYSRENHTKANSVIEEKPPNVHDRLLGICICLFVIVLLMFVIRFVIK